EGANSEKEEGQATSNSAKMSGNDANSTSSNEGGQDVSHSNKMSGGDSGQSARGNISGAAKGTADQLTQDQAEPLTLTNTQRAAADARQSCGARELGRS